ncbi:hypothetical protein [Polaromonas sp. JS666]|uniref:hypothetical protein n=1 Tax=Polaromonas sp. (strain JS666 / ATCC BAA-500) TaxID=296591 RepID=UPI0012ED4E03|nr:hypothetical protein [Polaromonas sp. JS666]UUZ71553.1 hypothetical protein LP415_21915 [Polaromonas sp. P1(28)-8]
MTRLIEPAGTTNRACQPLMVVVLVIWAKTGALLPAREAAVQRMGAGFLHMVPIVAKLGPGAAGSGLKPPGKAVV